MVQETGKGLSDTERTMPPEAAPNEGQGPSGLFAAVEAAAASSLVRKVTRRNWRKGEVIFQRGDEGDFLIAIIKGQIRLSVSTPEGKELVLRHVGPRQVIGEFSLIDGQPRSTDASAIESVEGIVLHRPDFLRALAEQPDLALALAQHLCGLLRSTNYQMESIALYDLRARVVRFLLLTLREVHGDSIPDTASIRFGLSQSELAAILGASRPKLNQVLQALAAEGAISRHGDQMRCDHRRLAEIAADQEPNW